MQCSEKVQKPQQLHLRLYRPLQAYYNTVRKILSKYGLLGRITMRSLSTAWHPSQVIVQMRQYTVLPLGKAKCHIGMLLVGWWFGFVLEPQNLNTSQSCRPWTPFRIQGEAICLTVKAGLNPISENLQLSSLKSKESTCCGGPKSRTQLKCCAWINPHKSKLTETI